MPNRVIEYVFKGDVSNLTAQMSAAGKRVSGFADQLTAADAKGQRWRSGLTELGGTAGKIGLLAAAGFTAFVGTSAKFDQSMSSVSAATHETAANMALLRQAAMDAGADTAFSASQAAGAVEELAKAGVSTKDILGGGLTGALDLAAAGELEVGTAAEIAATAMTQFGLGGDQVAHVADLLAAGAGKAQGSVTDLGGALKQSGLVASQMGIPIEETVGTLSAFASAGMVGSDAGTSFRTMLLRLANPTKESADLMKSLGINAYDAQGNFVGMESIAGQLQSSLGGMTQAQRDSTMATLFGSDAIRAANVLYDQGAVGVAKWTGNVDDAGYAAETAAARTDNLMGDIERLTGSLETALISGGEGAQAPLREAIQLLTDLVDAYAALPKPVQTGITGLLGLTAAAGGMAFVASKVITGVADTRKAMSDLGITSESLKGKLGGLKGAARLAAGAGGMILLADGMRRASSNAGDMTQAMGTLESAVGGAMAGFAVGGGPGAMIGTVVGLLGSYVGASKAAAEAADGFSDTLDRQTGALTDNSRAWVVEQMGPKNLQALKDAGVDIKEFTDIMVQGGPVARDYLDSLNIAGNEKGWLFRDDREDAIADAEKLIGVMDAGTAGWQLSSEAMGENAEAAEDAAGANDQAAGSIEGVGGSAATSAEQVLALVEAMKEEHDQALGAFDANIAYGQALADAREAANENAGAIRNNTEAGRENNRALSDLAGAWNNMDDTVRNSPGNYERARRQFIDVAVQMGYTRAEARNMADEFLNVPDEVATDVNLDGSQAAKAEVKKLNEEIAKIPESERTNLIVHPDTGKVTLHGKKIADIPKSQLSKLKVDPDTGKVTLHGNAIGRIPKDKMTDLRVDPETGKVTLHGIAIGKVSKSELTKLKVDPETGKITGFKGELSTIPSEKTTILTTIRKVIERGAGKADGGLISGAPRTPYGDKLLIGAAPGEYMVSNRHGQVDRNLHALQAANAGAKLAVVGYAGGGLILRGIPGYAQGGSVSAYDKLTGGRAVGYAASRSIAARYQLQVPPDLLYGLTNLTGVLSKTKDTVATDTKTRETALKDARRDARAKKGPGGSKVTAGERARINRLTRQLNQARRTNRRSVNTLTREVQTAEGKTRSRLNQFSSALDKAKDALAKEQQARQELTSSITAGLKSDLWADVGQTMAKEAGSVFARTTYAWSSTQSSAPPSVKDVNARLRQDIADAQAFTRLEKQLRNRGLSGAALNELIAAGDVNRLRTFAGASNAQLRSYQSLYNQRDRATATAANTAANVMGITSAIAKTNKQITTLTGTVRSLQRQLDAAERARNKTGKARETARKKQAPKNAAATGRAVAKANNKTAKNAKKR